MQTYDGSCLVVAAVCRDAVVLVEYSSVEALQRRKSRESYEKSRSRYLQHFLGAKALAKKSIAGRFSEIVA
jgi:hypothetical protein